MPTTEEQSTASWNAFRETIGQVAQALGGDWRMAEIGKTQVGQELALLTNGVLTISVRKAQDKLRVGADWPAHYHGLRSRVESTGGDHLEPINIAATKTPAVVAAEIKRRFLPDMQIVNERYESALAEHTQYCDKVKGTIQILTSAVENSVEVAKGEYWGVNGDMQFRPVDVDILGNVTNYDVKLRHRDRYLTLNASDNSVRFTGHTNYLSPELAAALFKLVQADNDGKLDQVTFPE